MRFLLLVTIVASASATDFKAQCQQNADAAAAITTPAACEAAASAVASTASATYGNVCAKAVTAAEAFAGVTTCAQYAEKYTALCNTVGDCAKKDDPCFPSSAKVVRTAGLFPEIVRIDELKEGDEILAATAEGTISKDMVSLLSIAKPEASASTYVVLKTAANYTVTLTEGHHIPVGESCCSKVKVAKEIAVGDVVHVARAHGLAATTVTSKTIGHSSGLHSPVLMNGGFPIVDGVVTSFDSIEKVTLAKYGLASLLKACKATGTCDKFRKTFFAEDRKYIDA